MMILLAYAHNLPSSFLVVLRRQPLWFLWDENDVGQI
jgi:hypothetical protein